MRIVVLGGGVIGTASAWFLNRDGHEVTLVERQSGVALATSFANGGQISVSHSEPWANPSAPAKVLRWLGREDAPLLFRLRPELHQWLWGLAFLRECLPARTLRNIRACVRLATYGRAQLQTLVESLAIDYDRVARGILHFYTSEREFEASLKPAALMRELGCNRRSISAAEAIAIEPALRAIGDRIAGADYCAEDESGDVFKFASNLAARAQAAGVRLLLGTEATRVVLGAGRVSAVEALGPDGWHAQLPADAVVVALGVESRALLRPLGVRLPLCPAKGYSVTYEILDAERAPKVSLTDDEHKLVISRLGNRLRVAGTAEFAGMDRSLNAVRCEMLARRTRELFPGACNFDRPRFWAGLRPVTPSNVPLIGRTAFPNLFINTGHGTLGWTMGVGSGKMIADIVAGRPPEVEAPPLPWT
jgi:D-amino-acid dehydrogenase